MLDSQETQSQGSYKSTPTTRSSLFQRAQQIRDKQRQENTMVETPTTTTASSSRSPAATPSSQTTASTRRRKQLSQYSQGEGDMSHHSQQQYQQQQQHEEEYTQENPHQQEAVVSPELLVDALSGHEDGLLAIAERMMEHYDRGYDAMGEAIIDAFADVQKLFQHVVEAAHMEGAAFEASRREEEIQELRTLLAAAQAQGGILLPPAALESGGGANGEGPSSPSGPVRHDEFIDQDVKDCLNEAIQKGAALKEAAKHLECFELYERACQSASALLPVDSDHRGRLQLSIARADSMSPDRGCAILRYAMDDVLRSGLRVGKTPLPDQSTRADVVLQKPKPQPYLSGIQSVQSTEEQLNSLVEEMKEILEAPVYRDTPLQEVAQRFWAALQESQKQQNRNEERLEQNLGKLKGDFLLARAVSIDCEKPSSCSSICVSSIDSHHQLFLCPFRSGKKNSVALTKKLNSTSNSVLPYRITIVVRPTWRKPVIFRIALCVVNQRMKSPLAFNLSTQMDNAVQLVAQSQLHPSAVWLSMPGHWSDSSIVSVSMNIWVPSSIRLFLREERRNPPARNNDQPLNGRIVEPMKLPRKPLLPERMVVVVPFLPVWWMCKEEAF